MVDAPDDAVEGEDAAQRETPSDPQEGQDPMRPLDAHVCAALGEALDATQLALAAIQAGSLAHGPTRVTLLAQLRRAGSHIHEARKLVTASGAFPAASEAAAPQDATLSEPKK